MLKTEQRLDSVWTRLDSAWTTSEAVLKSLWSGSEEHLNNIA